MHYFSIAPFVQPTPKRYHRRALNPKYRRTDGAFVRHMRVEWKDLNDAMRNWTATTDTPPYPTR